MSNPYRPNVAVHFPKTSREKNLDLVGLFYYLAGGFVALSNCAFVVIPLVRGACSPLGSPRLWRAPWAGEPLAWLMVLWLVLCWTGAALLIAAGRCIRVRRHHLFCVVVAGLSCLWLPLGTLLGVFALVLLTKLDVRLVFERNGVDAGDGTHPPVRPWLLVTGGIVAAAATSVFAWSMLTGRAPPRAAGPNMVAPDTQQERSRAAFLVAPGPIPSSLPLLGPEGTDADGYPTKDVDRAGLRTLLNARRFKLLDSYIEQLQAAFEADPRKEYWPIDAGDAFASAEPELNADLDAWAAARPDSFAAHLARGVHWVDVMWAVRGEKYIAQTPEADIRAMSDAARRAVVDLDEAIRLRPKLVAAMRQEMRVAMAVSDRARLEKMRDRALQTCPSCLQPRATYLAALTPRWGGNEAAMRSFVTTSPLPGNPRLRVLSGYVDFDRAETLEGDHKLDDALSTIDLALKAGDYWEYRLERARILGELRRFDDALADLNGADAQRPMHPWILSRRAYVQRARQQFVAAGRDLLATLRVEPSNTDGKRVLPSVIEGVVWQARHFDEQHEHTAALETAELALDLGPTDSKTHAAYAWIVLGDATTPERVAELQKYVAANPGDFRKVQQLDYALSRQNRFPEILVLWDAYLAEHPDDGRAYMERAGTSHHLGKLVQRRTDAARACELGVSEGCERVGTP